MTFGSYFHGELVGNLGANPSPVKGNKGVKLSIAVQEVRDGDDQSDRQQITHWYDVVIWGENRTRTVCDKLRKGDKVAVQVSVSTNSYRPDGSSKDVKGINFSCQPGQNWYLLGKGQPKDQGGDRYVDESESQEPPRGRSSGQRDSRHDDSRRPSPPNANNRSNGRDSSYNRR